MLDSQPRGRNGVQKCLHSMSSRRITSWCVKKHYAGVLLDYVGEVLLVGINYDKNTKRHECRIEKMFMSAAEKYNTGSWE